jgi:hypothetical protein
MAMPYSELSLLNPRQQKFFCNYLRYVVLPPAEIPPRKTLPSVLCHLLSTSICTLKIRRPAATCTSKRSGDPGTLLSGTQFFQLSILDFLSPPPSADGLHYLP